MSRSRGESAHDAPGGDGADAGSGASPTRGGSSLSPGTMLGKYRIVRPLGSGGMAAVYEALHTGIGKPVAIKTLRAVATEARAEARFLREAAAASRLDHPHVVDVTDFGTENGLSYLVMELLRGEDMGAVVAREPGTLDPTFVVDVMLAVCAGVFAAHESGVIHRDLKPQNIFLARTPLGELVPKVLDFGISKRLDEDVGARLTNSGALLGTTHYLSPEQIAGKPLDVRSDQYSLGVILYEALTGQRPHEGNTAYVVMHSIGEGKFALPRKLRPDIPAPLEAVVVRAMSGRPQDRFESVHDLGRALLPLASSKRRVIWSDYYERDRPPVSPAAPPSYPDPPRPPVSNEKGTMAIDAFRGQRADATRTRSAPVMRPPAPTRMALPQQVAALAEAKSTAESGALEADPRSGRGKSGARSGAKKTAPARSSGLRNAVVIAGLIALGAGGYAAWVDPDMADRIPQNVKASIKRHLPADQPAEGEGTPAAGNVPATAEARPVPVETRVTLGEKPIPISGGLTPPSAEELEAVKAASQPPDAAPAAVDPAAGAPVDLGEKSPEELAAAGSPEPSEPGPMGIRPSTAGGRRGLPAQSRPATGADVRAGVVEPYAPGDATMRTLRLLKQQEKKRRESGFSPDTQPRPRQDSPPADSVRVKPSLNPAGAPILE